MYYTIAGIEDRNHLDVLKFYDRRSAQSFLDMILRLGCAEHVNWYVEGHTP